MTCMPKVCFRLVNTQSTLTGKFMCAIAFLLILGLPLGLMLLAFVLAITTANPKPFVEPK